LVDTYYNWQWGLKNTGQNGGVAGVDIKIESVWSIRQGNSNIKIAVIDHGVDLTHPDLQANLLSGYDASGNNSGGAPVLSYGGKDYHGTACAGIIAAIKDNNEGIAGIAPNCKIIPVHAVNSSGFIDKDLVANSIQWAWQNGADVMSLSWSSVSEYTPLTNAINTAVAQGRNGKGCILVFSTGNNSVSEVHFPAKLPNVIAVGSADRYGDRASSSNYGSALNVVAPGVGIYTTDLQGSAGYSSGNYHFSFSGTSAATPHVAGVAALVLSAHPNLTAEQVRQAIESTCTKLPNYTFSSNSTHLSGTWNEQVGYGLVNAYAAVQAGACPTTNFTNQTVNTNTIIVSNCGDINVQNVSVQNGAKLTLDAAGSTTINAPFEVVLGSELEIK
ncbi:MAG: S8 family serine peptidase, partial [Dysgonamonadaceae bacterium]|nr:S8 family serine peptidase [Dysgonamonadaceae bacterium]